VTHDKPGIAVAVIALNEALGMRRLLDALLAEPFDEIAVADGGSTDGTLDIIAQEPRVRLVHAPRGRGRQINAAVKATRSPILTILHADTLLPRGAAKLIRESLAPPDVAAGCFQLRFDVQHPVLDAYAWATRFETSLTTFGDQAYFMRRAAFDAIGSAPEWPLLEDVWLRDHLKKVGRFVKRPECVVTSARRFTRRGALRGQVRNAAVLAGYRLGIPVQRLADFYASTGR
jgi:rSAM/selenodomain-associated transferase 2